MAKGCLTTKTAFLSLPGSSSFALLNRYVEVFSALFFCSADFLANLFDELILIFADYPSAVIGTNVKGFDFIHVYYAFSSLLNA